MNLQLPSRPRVTVMILVICPCLIWLGNSVAPSDLGAVIVATANTLLGFATFYLGYPAACRLLLRLDRHILRSELRIVVVAACIAWSFASAVLIYLLAEHIIRSAWPMYAATFLCALTVALVMAWKSLLIWETEAPDK